MIVDGMAESQEETGDPMPENTEQVTPADENSQAQECPPDEDDNPQCDGDAPDQDANTEVFLRHICSAESRCRIAELEMLSAKSALKDAKGEYDSAVDSLRSLIRGMLNDLDRPLLNQSTDEPDPEQDPDPDAESPGPKVDWTVVPVSEISLPSGILNKLEENGVTTIGQLENLRAEVSMGKEKWPKGIGPAKVSTIEDRVLSWLSEHRDKAVLEESAK